LTRYQFQRPDVQTIKEISLAAIGSLDRDIYN
jgi:hypothetical protein